MTDTYYEFTSTGLEAGPIHPDYRYQLGLSDFAPWFKLAVFVGPHEYDLGSPGESAALTFWSATPLNLGMIGYLDGRDSINYLWSSSEIDVSSNTPLHVAGVPEPSTASLIFVSILVGVFIWSGAHVIDLFWRSRR